jgi:hypothetical protein
VLELLRTGTPSQNTSKKKKKPRKGIEEQEYEARREWHQNMDYVKNTIFPFYIPLSIHFNLNRIKNIKIQLISNNHGRHNLPLQK